VTTILSAWNAESGALLWRRDYSEEFDPSYAYYGTAASPLVWDGLCFVHFGGHQRGETKETDRGAMIALKVSDGSEVWRWSEDSPSQGASSLTCEIDGRQQLLVKAKQMIAWLDARTGEELWRIPYKIQMDNSIVTPLVVGNLLITSDYRKGVSAWQIQSHGDSWAVERIWINPLIYMVTSSPLMIRDQLVGFGYTRSGELFGLDSSNGELYASIVWGDR
jgi:outer membrane protein assembly factor BamB